MPNGELPVRTVGAGVPPGGRLASLITDTVLSWRLATKTLWVTSSTAMAWGTAPTSTLAVTVLVAPSTTATVPGDRPFWLATKILFVTGSTARANGDALPV